MNTTKRRPRLVAALVIAMCLGLSACGTAHSALPRNTRTERGTSTTPTSTTPDRPVTRCTTSQLKLSHQGGAGATGTLHEWYGFTNVGESTCSLYGYPGYQPLSAQGQPLPENLVRTEEPGSSFNGGLSTGPPRTVDLAPGATATFSVAYGDLYPVSGEICETASSIEVWPPNQTQALQIVPQHAAITYCGRPPSPTIDIGPVVALNG